jgi:hypothetical protein
VNGSVMRSGACQRLQSDCTRGDRKKGRSCLYEHCQTVGDELGRKKEG